MSEIIGFTAGAFDMFHIGHLNILRSAKALCDKLIVGVSTDELIKEYKKHKPIIPFNERIEIVRSIRYTDVVIPQYDLDKVNTYYQLKYNILFVGSDHYSEESWDFYEDILDNLDVKVIYLPYTKDISSTILRRKIKYYVHKE